MLNTLPCPHCGAKFDFVDGKAGHLKKCGTCGEWVNSPLAGKRPEVDQAIPPATENNGNKLFDIVTVVVGVGIGLVVLAGLLLPGVNGGPPGKRTQCQNNLKQIALALHNYHDVYKTLPPAYIADEKGRPKHSWRVLILPFIEQQSLYQRYNFDEPWDSPRNLRVAQLMPLVYGCPSSYQSGDQRTPYQVIVGPHTAFPGASSCTLANIKDGLSNTLMVAEASSRPVLWTKPVDLDFNKMQFKIGGGPGEIDSEHAGVAHTAFTDGSVRSLTEDTPPWVVRAMAGRDDNVSVPDEY